MRVTQPYQLGVLRNTGTRYFTRTAAPAFRAWYDPLKTFSPKSIALFKLYRLCHFLVPKSPVAHCVYVAAF